MKTTLVYTKNDQGEFTCSHCDFTARIQSTMHYHLKKHEGILPHPCKHCDERFPQKGRLDLHIRLKHSHTLEKKETFKCPCVGCEYEDIRKGNRLIHFLRVHMKDVTESLKCKTGDEGCVAGCKVCCKSFKSMTQFYYHAASCVNPKESHPSYAEWALLKA